MRVKTGSEVDTESVTTQPVSDRTVIVFELSAFVDVSRMCVPSRRIMK